MNTLKTSLLAAALLTPLFAEQSITLEPLIVESSAFRTDELKETQAVEIYTAKDIQKAHVQNVYEFLNEATSVFATSGYGNPFVQKIDMRGYGVGDGYQNIVVTVDGRRMNNIDMVPQLLACISPSSIERIEIIKSSGIVTAGDGANAGAINIITKKGDTKEVSFYGGTYGTADGTFYVGHKDEKLSVSLNGEAQKNDGIRTVESNGGKDANRFSTFAFHAGYMPNEALRLRLGASTTNTDVTYGGTMTKAEYEANPSQQGTVDYGFGPTASSSTHQTYKSNTVDAGATYFVNDALKMDVDLSRENKESNFITYGSIYDSKYSSAKLALTYETTLYSVKAGLDGYEGSFAKRSSTVDITKKNQAAYMLGRINLDSLTLDAGYRYEKVVFQKPGNSDINEYLYGAQLGANYLLDPRQSLFASYAHSYESANVDRLFSLFSGAYTGYVKPSKADNFEVGYNYIDKTNKFKASLYYISLKDEIYYYPGVNYVGAKNTNIDRSHKYGFDLYDKYIVNDAFNIALDYNYVKALIDKELQGSSDYSGNDLPGVSNHNIKAALSYLPNRHTTFVLTQIYRSEAYAANDLANNFTQKQPAYMSTDLSASYAKDNYELFAKITNLFNQKNALWIQDDALYPVNFTTTAFAGIKLKF